MARFDIAVVGAGIAGASLAAELALHARVLLLEAESTPGYHATGRSAAFWSETYGGPTIQPLTTASGPALRDGGFLQPLGSLHIGTAGDQRVLDAFQAQFEGRVTLERVNPATRVPGLRERWTLGLFEPTCAFIDVAALHASYLAAARRGGVDLVTDARLLGAVRGGGAWQLSTSVGEYRADILVDAAGAWADPVAMLAGARPLGIRPLRRTMVQLLTDPPAPATLPHVTDFAGSFYFKPEPGGRLWLSPHDEIESEAVDAAPEELDVALAIDRLQGVVDWQVTKVERRWAGLRSFAPDRLPVYGFDPQVPGFFWCAGQGGFGIQTAPAAAKLAAALLLRSPGTPTIDPARYDPARFLPDA